VDLVLCFVVSCALLLFDIRFSHTHFVSFKRSAGLSSDNEEDGEKERNVDEDDEVVQGVPNDR